MIGIFTIFNRKVPYDLRSFSFFLFRKRKKYIITF
nr:MAG TPA: hypothetical protein [Caudoviricetes sp.]